MVSPSIWEVVSVERWKRRWKVKVWFDWMSFVRLAFWHFGDEVEEREWRSEETRRRSASSESLEFRRQNQISSSVWRMLNRGTAEEEVHRSPKQARAPLILRSVEGKARQTARHLIATRRLVVEALRRNLWNEASFNQHLQLETRS